MRVLSVPVAPFADQRPGTSGLRREVSVFRQHGYAEGFVQSIFDALPEAVGDGVARKTLVLGLQDLSRRDLESVRKAGSKLRIHVLGLVRIASDVSPALARDTIESVEVLGALHASPAVKAALADRIH